MTDFAEATQFAGSAPLIALAVALIKSNLNISPKLLPGITMVMSAAWGSVLLFSGYFEADLPTFILMTITVAMAASGTQSVLRTYAPDIVRLGKNGSTSSSR